MHAPNPLRRALLLSGLGGESNTHGQRIRATRAFGIRRIGRGHIDLMTVVVTVVIAVGIDRAGSMGIDLRAVAQPVVVGVRHVGLGADLVFLKVC